MPGLFEVPVRATRQDDLKVAKKSKSKKSAPKAIRSGNSLMARIAEIKQLVESKLGQYKDKYEVITDPVKLSAYIDKCIENNCLSIDTETDGLDPLLDRIAGICIYTPGLKASYIPVNHVSYITHMKVDNQLPVDFLKEQFQRIVDNNVFTVMFNANFDIRVMRNWIGVSMNCDWDCYLAARLLNENEGPGNNKLKKLHQKYVLNGVGDAFSFDELFKGIPFTQIPINVGYLYSAHDPDITYELYQFQRPYLTADDPECIKHELQDVAWVFHNIEMPCVSVVAEMEDTGIELDLDYTKQLSEKYNHDLKDAEANFYKQCEKYEDAIDEYRRKTNNCKLDDPINISSPTQIAILLYDILKLDAGVDKVTKQPIRATGEAILKSLDHPICEAILKYREIEKLVKTYIDKLPNCVNPNDGRIHCKFNQYGADTGRFSSSDPNLQNIPSHNKDIRKMFVATNDEFDTDIDDTTNSFSVYQWDEIMTPDGWKCANSVNVGDKLTIDCDGKEVILTVVSAKLQNNYIYFVCE